MGHVMYLLLASTFLQYANCDTHNLAQGDRYFHEINRARSYFEVFCYTGKPKYLIHIWQTVQLQLDHPNDDFSEYTGDSPQSVHQDYMNNKYSWNLFATKHKQIQLDPFNNSCVGIYSKYNYTVTLNVIRIDYWKVLLLSTGIFLFFSAKKLSKNSLFYYLCGVTFGICTSFLVLIYFISKLFPRKSLMYGAAACGWTLGVYLLQLLWDNIRVILSSYKSYVVWYTIITGAISFIICYRWGPVENQRTRNLIQWSLQGLSLVLIYFSTRFQEAAMGQIVCLLVFHNVPETWLLKTKKYWKKRFPPKINPLSNDEYYQQGVRETTKALEELRQFCSSPECKQWQLATKLKDVKRFASFVEGNSHLSDDEILEYETTIQTTDLTDDEDYTDEEL